MSAKQRASCKRLANAIYELTGVQPTVVLYFQLPHLELPRAYVVLINEETEEATTLECYGNTNLAALRGLLKVVYKHFDRVPPRCDAHCSGMRDYVRCGLVMEHASRWHNYNNSTRWPKEK